MTNSIDRRKAFTSITSAMLAPAALLPATALALASPATPDNADHEIFALFEEWKALRPMCEAAEKRCTVATDAAKLEYPERRYGRPRDAGYDSDSLNEAFEKFTPPIVDGKKDFSKLELLVDHTLAKDQEFLNEWNSEKSAIDAKWNVRALSQKHDDISTKRYAVEQFIFDAPAQTATGLLIKLTVWDSHYYEHDGNEKPQSIRSELGKFGVSL